MNGPDAALARRLARRAGRVLLGIRATTRDPERLGGRGDRAAARLLTRELRRRRPADALLSEEEPDGDARHTAERVWIVDPLDGTREFGEPGRSDWAVHVALWQAGELVAGAVALPDLRRTYTTHAPPVYPPARNGAVRIAVSRTRPPARAHRLAAALGAELVPMGSAGAKVAAVLRGAADAYVHGGGQYEWDSAAPVAVARAAGLHTSRLDGSALTYNNPDPTLPDLLVCRPELASTLLDELARAA
ncbi:inositol monophosphatase family protein [Haloechinothrix sp. LS1_15]|uniref:inositol monophosphatase family protein n=1 Tax=Haloechinothrix sp. LS1_15 TaxID=2652248 RepID=UPI00294417B9|nr:inositol monophosphatase family protein [Haloechinothrix sp. LS1_15]MDV6011679.1 3'(2'),5'-bisphosphate nucleotidase CysQ [Haloechinothrix sp. LS1_15]